MNIPDEAVKAASDAVYEAIPIVRKSCDEVAASALAAALPHLLPGLYVTRHGGYLEVWRENPEHPDRPHALDAREACEALALILPDRTDEAKD